jgi:carbon monoxide dehydrogenase subunit G
VLLDVERITPCLPGASLTGRDGDDYKGQMRIKLGPIVSTYSGTLRIEEADEAQRRAVLVASARDTRNGTASATIVSAMHPHDGGATRIVVETDLGITGPAAQFGRGVMQEVSGKLMTQFATALEAEILRDHTQVGGKPSPQSEPAAAEQPAPSADSRVEDILDLSSASRTAVLRRVGPVALALLLVVLLLRRRR